MLAVRMGRRVGHSGRAGPGAARLRRRHPAGGRPPLHARARSPAGLAVFGALTGISALAALFVGVLLTG